ncbi:UDP-glucose 4-epimerase [Rhizobium sp. Root274]|uniref:UDP-glucose 4-epimerase GalE n=1 Tax=unclassified Rhizobium TaxID=2613769 RepID=UPI0007124E38|nr:MULTISPECIES: UDP-glucose 4-epimerase GalE [unclassified Rhizobium]KQW31665.1 UDP-glucose 4-epimerase [Rhizobium sp. Root1240]KRD33206.1 UDP-glucose 4-epimerase [Rhizobium sp. Root274]
MTETKILVTGGAGYIGSHTCLALAAKGFIPVVYDNFSSGHREFVKWGPVEEGDIRDRARLREVLTRHKPAAVLHFAGLIEVSQSFKEPEAFYDINVVGSLNLLQEMMEADIRAFVFSSTCATYGQPQYMPLDEAHPQAPINPYGRTKHIVEQALRDFALCERMRSVMLRYFNAAGADNEGRIGEWHTPETHAIPLLIEAALGRRQGFSIFGDDYDTRDGTCIRDYVHVSDLADAHVRAVEYLLNGGDTVAINLGTGTGTSVQELVTAVEAVSGRPLPVTRAERRPGDPPLLVASNATARDILGWEPERHIDDIIRSAWTWHRRFNGYS